MLYKRIRKDFWVERGGCGFVLQLILLFGTFISANGQGTSAESIDPFNDYESHINNISMSTGQLNLSLELLSLPLKNGTNMTVAGRYSSNVHINARAENDIAPTSWLGLGWHLHPGTIACHHRGTMTYKDDAFYWIAPGGNVRSIYSKDGQFWIEDEPYLRLEPTVRNVTTEVGVNPVIAGWTMYNTDGTRYFYGDLKTTSEGFHYDGLARASNMATRYTFCWHETGHVGEGFSGTPALYPYQWDLSRVEKPKGSYYTLEYDQTKSPLRTQNWQSDPADGSNKYAYTQASYLRRVSTDAGWYAEFNREKKGWREYVDPNELAEEPDAFMETYESDFLKSIVVKNGSGTKTIEIKTVSFEYNFLDDLGNDFHKRLLTRIEHSNEGVVGDFYEFAYVKNVSESFPNYGAISSTNDMRGRKREFSYTRREWAFKKQKRLDGSWGYGAPGELSNGNPFVVASRAYDNKLCVFNWDGHQWSMAAKDLNPFAGAPLFLAVNRNYIYARKHRVYKGNEPGYEHFSHQSHIPGKDAFIVYGGTDLNQFAVYEWNNAEWVLTFGPHTISGPAEARYFAAATQDHVLFQNKETSNIRVYSRMEDDWDNVTYEKNFDSEVSIALTDNHLAIRTDTELHLLHWNGQQWRQAGQPRPILQNSDLGIAGNNCIITEAHPERSEADWDRHTVRALTWSGNDWVETLPKTTHAPLLTYAPVSRFTYGPNYIVACYGSSSSRDVAANLPYTYNYAGGRWVETKQTIDDFDLRPVAGPDYFALPKYHKDHLDLFRWDGKAWERSTVPIEYAPGVSYWTGKNHILAMRRIPWNMCDNFEVCDGKRERGEFEYDFDYVTCICLKHLQVEDHHSYAYVWDSKNWTKEEISKGGPFVGQDLLGQPIQSGRNCLITSIYVEYNSFGDPVLYPRKAYRLTGARKLQLSYKYQDSFAGNLYAYVVSSQTVHNGAGDEVTNTYQYSEKADFVSSIGLPFFKYAVHRTGANEVSGATKYTFSTGNPKLRGKLIRREALQTDPQKKLQDNAYTYEVEQRPEWPPQVYCARRKYAFHDLDGVEERNALTYTTNQIPSARNGKAIFSTTTATGAPDISRFNLWADNIYPALIDKNQLSGTAMELQMEEFAPLAAPELSPDWYKHIAKDKIRAAKATVWDNTHNPSAYWAPSSIYGWKIETDENGVPLKDFKAFNFENPEENLSNGWEPLESITRYNASGRPLEKKFPGPKESNVFGAMVYRNDIGRRIAVISNAHYDECGVYTCDYLSEGNISYTSSDSRNGLDALNAWESALIQGKTSSAITLEAWNDGEEGLFGERYIKVVDAEGPARNFRILPGKDYVLSAWVKVHAGTGDAWLHADYRKLDPSDTDNEMPFLLEEPFNRNDPSNFHKVTGSPKIVTAPADVSQEKWVYEELSIPARTDLDDNNGDWFVRARVGTPEGGTVSIQDIRFYPADAIVHTFYYDHKFQMPRDTVDAAGQPSERIEYDRFGRPTRWTRMVVENGGNPRWETVKEKVYHLHGEGLDVRSPNHNEKYCESEQIEIRWYDANRSPVNIDYSTDGTATWTGIVSGHPYNGLYTWTPGSALGDCYIRIEQINFPFHNVVIGPISIAEGVITVASPKHVRQYRTGADLNIDWVTRCDVNDVSLDFTTDAGDSWTTITSETENDGEYSWPIPPDWDTSKEYIIRIRELDHPETIQAQSEPFTFTGSFFIMKNLLRIF